MNINCLVSLNVGAKLYIKLYVTNLKNFITYKDIIS